MAKQYAGADGEDLLFGGDLDLKESLRDKWDALEEIKESFARQCAYVVGSNHWTQTGAEACSKCGKQCLRIRLHILRDGKEIGTALQDCGELAFRYASRVQRANAAAPSYARDSAWCEVIKAGREVA